MRVVLYFFLGVYIYKDGQKWWQIGIFLLWYLFSDCLQLVLSLGSHHEKGFCEKNCFEKFFLKVFKNVFKGNKGNYEKCTGDLAYLFVEWKLFVLN